MEANIGRAQLQHRLEQDHHYLSVKIQPPHF
jgi:hypothetical protein